MQIDHTEVREVMKGVREWRNKDNGFYVLEIHYSADPGKDPSTPEGAEWLSEVRKGFTEEREFLQEYEIDDLALSSGLVYAGFSLKKHVLDFDLSEFDPKWIYCKAIDPGIGDECGCVWCAVTPDNYHFVYDEYKKANLSISENVKNILNIESMHPFKTTLSLIDPSARNRQMSTTRTIRRDFQEAGIDCRLADNNIEGGINDVRELLNAEDPKLIIHPRCVNLIKEMQSYQLKNGKPIDRHNHLLDPLRYIVRERLVNHFRTMKYNPPVPIYENRHGLRVIVGYRKRSDESDVQ